MKRIFFIFSLLLCLLSVPVTGFAAETDEEQVKFFAENPDFMSGYPIDRNRIKLLRDPIYRRLMRKIKRYEESKK